ncbi:MAG: glycoside hydrolase family 65 protein [Bacteroidota bacterium]
MGQTNCKFRTITVFIALLFHGGLIWGQEKAPWTIEADLDQFEQYAGVTVANGIIGVVSSPNPFQVKDIVMAGAYDVNGRGRVSNFIRNINPLNLFVEVDGHRISSANASNHTQQLDFYRGKFSSQFNFEDKATVKVTYRALRQLPYNTLVEVTVTAHKPFLMNAGSIIDTPESLRGPQNLHTQINVTGGTLNLMTTKAKSPSEKLELAACSTLLFPEEKAKEPVIIHEQWDANRQLMRFNKALKKGESYTFSVVSALLSSAHQADPYNESERLAIYGALQGRNQLVESHEAAWKTLWEEGDIIVKGDPQLQQDLRNMLYHLYAFVREESAYSLSPMGLSGLGYNGHIFWDTDIWVFPALLVLQPQLAKSLIEYRFDRLDAAKRNAWMHGYKGAMYPWESAVTGDEETPTWALSGPFEHHISACVGIAAWNYYSVTQDTTWLEEKGWPMMEAIGEFWLSRVTEDSNGQFHIKNVVGADEWAENIDNDAWTNGAVKTHFNNLKQAAIVLGKPLNTAWSQVANNLIIERFPDGTTREHRTYDGEPVKQADVNLLAYPLNIVTEANQIRKDLEYYKLKIPDIGTPAMTKSIFALLYARLGDTEKAYEAFLDAHRPNQWGPFRVIMEAPRSYNPYFVTAAGGNLQTLLMGFGGLKITDKGLVKEAVPLPKKWKQLILKGVGPENKTYTLE